MFLKFRVQNIFIPRLRVYRYEEKKEETCLSPMTKAHIPTENTKTAKLQHKNVNKNFDYTTMKDRLRTVSLNIDSLSIGVVKPVYRIPIFPLAANAV